MDGIHISFSQNTKAKVILKKVVDLGSKYWQLLMLIVAYYELLNFGRRNLIGLCAVNVL